MAEVAAAAQFHSCIASSCSKSVLPYKPFPFGYNAAGQEASAVIAVETPWRR